ncbi:alpha/beta fold hydrolase [Nocardioides sp.]|uniref:alpha/beta fold hydrolase n=1 Tax=Nocardioides sp. TaxID=35761 RepID=UPI0031FED5B0|nr:alpha/beta hydrolase fold protein [Nocardioides sp.]
MSYRIRTFRRDGLTFDVLDEGPVAGPVVVLLHGFPERSSAWRDVAPLLHGRGLRTLAMDQRGYSPGARPKRRRDYRFGLLVDDVAALITQVGGPVHVVGHDLGAAVGWFLAARHPELVRTLTAVSVPHPRAFVSALLTSGQVTKSWYMAAFQLPRIPELTAARPGGRFDQSLLSGGMTEDEVARFRTEIVDYGALTGALNWYRAMPLVGPLMQRSAVRVPTTYIWSDGEIAVDRRSAVLAERWVDAPYEFVVLPGVSHWIPTQAPEACAAAILERIGSVG